MNPDTMNTSETQQRPTRPENRTYRDREPELQRLITNTLSTVLKLGAISIDAAMNPGGDIAEAQYYVQELVQEIRYLLDDGMLDALDRYDPAAAYKEQQEREETEAELNKALAELKQIEMRRLGKNPMAAVGIPPL